MCVPCGPAVPFRAAPVVYYYISFAVPLLPKAEAEADGEGSQPGQAHGSAGACFEDERPLQPRQFLLVFEKRKTPFAHPTFAVCNASRLFSLSLPFFVPFVHHRQTFCLWLDPATDVGTVKEKLLEHRSKNIDIDDDNAPSTALFLPNDVLLVWNGKPLDEKLLLSEYGVPSDSTVHVSAKNRGGCFMVSFSIICTIIAAIIGSTCTCGLSLLIVPLLMPLLFILPFFCL